MKEIDEFGLLVDFEPGKRLTRTDINYELACGVEDAAALE